MGLEAPTGRRRREVAGLRPATVAPEILVNLPVEVRLR
jgi:hypothetical protein